MNHSTFCLAVLTATALTGATWAEPITNKDVQPLRLELNLWDGSRVIGVPAIETVSVETSYAKMNIPLKQIQTLKIGEDHETVSIDLQNGDKLNGVINLAPLKLSTIFGQVSIGTAHIKQFYVVLGGGQAAGKLSDWTGWHLSGDSVKVDPVKGCLLMVSDGKNSDRAFKDISLSLPVVLESRSRLVCGGRNYTLPWLNVFCGTDEGSGGRINCGSVSQGLRSQWLIFLNKPDWPATLSMSAAAKPSRGENVWVTIKAVIENEKGHLYVKHDDETEFSLVSEQSWPRIDTQVKRIAVEQPWDAECDIEYVTITEHRDK